MEMRVADMIDRYLRNEMTDTELQQFEQQAMNDVALHRDVELVYAIKRRLAARQQKLHRMREWSKKRRYKVLRYGVAASVAAVAVATLVGYNHSVDMVADNTLPIVAAQPKCVEKPVRDASPVGVTASTTSGADSEATSEKRKHLASDVEKEMNALPSYTGNVEQNYMSVNDYERNWKQILSLLHKDNYAELIPLLEAYAQVSGRHQSAADSLLQRYQNKLHHTLRNY